MVGSDWFGLDSRAQWAVNRTVIATVRPIQTRYAELRKDDGTVHAILRQGAAQAREQTQQKVREVRARLGLLP